jgi:uncharacterized damage-inducible protein DinB
MPDLTAVIAGDLDRYYKRVSLEIYNLVDTLSQDDFWRRPHSYGNSAGHLLLHLTGNLNYYIGAQIAGTGYVRNRPLEFSDSSRPPKDQVVKNFLEAVVMVQSTLAKQSEADLVSAYSARGMEDAGDRFTVFLRCAAHLSHHTGQIIYLCKELQQKPCSPK